jgi:branched-chain amino acid transport system substrate-binding protein
MTFYRSILSLLVVAVLTLPVQADQTIKIASIFSKTGEAAEYTKEFYWGAHIAVDLINEKGGVLGKQIELIELDNESTVEGCIKAARQAVTMGVTAVYGAAWSSHSMAMAPVLEKAGVPMISPASTNPAVTKLGDYIFRTCFTDSFQGDVMAYFAINDLKATSAAILTDVSSDFSIALSGYFKNRFEQMNQTVGYTGEYLKGNIDFKTLLSPLVSQQPDVVFLPGYISDSGFIIKQARQLGIQSTFLGTDGWGGARQLYDIAGESISGSYLTAPWHRNVSFPLGQEYTKAYEAKLKTEIFPFAPMIYDAFIVLADAIERAEGLDRKRIRDEMAKTRGLEGASGVITFDENGDPLNKDAVILVIKGNKTDFHKSIKIQ